MPPMARSARIVIPGCPHHATHRANRGEPIFPAPEYFRLYRRWFQECAVKHGLQVWAYCLMTNHVHLVVVPAREESLSLGIGQAHLRYSQWLNRTQGWSGHAWVERFHSVPMDEPHLWAAMKYVELNPVRAGLVTRPEDYPWSSAPAHILAVPDPMLSGALSPGAPQPGREWRDWLEPGVEEATIRLLRLRTRTGRPLGSREFITGLEARLGRPLSPRKPGPKRRA
jgi:putative transposase